MHQPPSSIRTLADYREFQRQMSALLFRPLTSTDAMQRKGIDGTPVRQIVESFVKPNDRLDSFERLEIYNRQYWFRALDCLIEDHPGLHALIGAKKFHALSVAYLVEKPSVSWTLRNLDSRLAAFMEANPQFTAPKNDMSRDMALFERAQTLAFDEARQPALSGDDLLGSDVSELRLGLQPHISLLELNYEVDEFSIAVKQNEQSMRSGASNALNEGPQHAKVKRIKAPAKKHIWLVVHRFKNSVYFKRLDREAFLILGAIRDGLTVASAIELALTEADPAVDWAGKIKKWFENWASLGWFCRAKKQTPTR